jgi:hypothetical protein
MRLMQHSLILVMMILLCGFTSCSIQRHQKGGGATTEVQQGRPAPKPDNIDIPDNVNFVGGPELHMGINQPENPEGVSTMSSKQTTTTVYPDGVIVIANTETQSSIGGSQELKEIVEAYVKSDYFKGLLIALALAVGAWMMYKKDWPLGAGILFIGAVGSVMVTWWIGGLSVLAVATLYIGFKIGLPIPPELV